MKVANLKDTFSSSTHADYARQYHEACAWFEQFGFNLAATRLQRYRDIVNELSGHQQGGTLKTAQFSHEFPDQINAAGEISEILRIHRGLKSLFDSALRSRIEKVLSGKTGRPSPHDFDPARDTAFELLVASRLHDAGYILDFSKDADLVLTIDGNDFFVECKRLKSRQGMRKRLKDGLKQLHRRYVDSVSPATCRGFLAVSISDMANPGHDLLVAATPEEMGKMASAIIDRFIIGHQDIWQQTRDARTIGVLVEFSTVGIIKTPHMVTTCTQVGVNNSCPVNSSEYSLLWKLSQQMAQSDT